MLELRPTCEHCDVELAPDALDARICTYECTFCARCTDELLAGVCPNCTGELVTRPVRPAALLGATPASTERVHSPIDLDAHRAMLAGRSAAGDHAGVVLRRYVGAWQRSDLATLIDCYHDDFTLHYGGTSRFRGSHRGRDAAVAAMAAVSTLAPRELVSIDVVLSSDRAGAVVATERLTRGDETAEVTRTLQYEVRDGRLVECWLLEHDQATVDHLWR
jgi:ketosteroid isomerase-like protein